MGVELAKAQIAFQLGKLYRQDEILNWGAATPPVSEEEQEGTAQAAHNLKEGYKEAGSTLKASQKKKRKTPKRKN